MDDCLFCRIVSGKLPSTRVHEDDRVIAIMDIFPATRGHALVLPRAHAQDVRDVADADLEATARVAKLLSGRAVRNLGAAGVTVMQSNGAAAWQTVFHYHVHVIPRYPDDPLVLPWKPGGEPADGEALAEVAAAYRTD
ncbi:MAG TPA: HIT family protein [Gaiellales bacterium]|nr:HIT family protein [Gaiellales bacterium]